MKDREWSGSTIYQYRSDLPRLIKRRSQLELKQSKRELSLSEQRELERLQRRIAHREAVLAEVDRREAERRADSAAEERRIAQIEAEIDQADDATLQELVNGVEWLLMIDSARQYGLVEGGPEIDLERCYAALRVGERRGIKPVSLEG